jgi:hypothetical protein
MLQYIFIIFMGTKHSLYMFRAILEFGPSFSVEFLLVYVYYVC